MNAQGAPLIPSKALSTVLSETCARRPPLRRALGLADSAAPPGGTCGIHAPSRRLPQAPAGPRSRGGQAGHPQGTWVFPRWRRAWESWRAGWGPRATGCGTLAGPLRPARCACECACRRQPPRQVPPSGHGARPQPPHLQPRPHAPGHAERQTSAPGRPRAGRAGRGRAAGPAAHWPSAVPGAGRRGRRASALRQAEAGAGRRDRLLAGRGGGGRALRDGSTEGRSQARRRAPSPELGFCRWARLREPGLRPLFRRDH